MKRRHVCKSVEPHLTHINPGVVVTTEGNDGN